MDFGDLAFLVMIGIGVLSSAFGTKKKKPGRQIADVPPVRDAPQPQRQARKNVASAMQEILKELQIVPPGEGSVAVEAANPRGRPPGPPRRKPHVQDLKPSREALAEAMVRHDTDELEIARRTDWQAAVDRPEEQVLGAGSHKKFHDEFIKPVKLTRAHKSSAARVRRFMKREGLKDAMLAYEIFGPPKGLR